MTLPKKPLLVELNEVQGQNPIFNGVVADNIEPVIAKIFGRVTTARERQLVDALFRLSLILVEERLKRKVHELRQQTFVDITNSISKTIYELLGAIDNNLTKADHG